LNYKNCVRRADGILGFLLVLAFAQSAMCQTRITSAINNNERVPVSGTTPDFLAQSAETGRVSGSQNSGRMLLMLAPTREQESAAQKLVSALHDASSPSFHKWLTWSSGCKARV
jgi:hypothetical protein